MNGDCEYELDGHDTDGTPWYRCTTHDELALSPDAPCAGYVEIPYAMRGTRPTPLDVARNLAGSDSVSDRALGVAMVARGLSDDDGLRQGWPLETAVDAAIEYLGLVPDHTLYESALHLAPEVSDAMLNKGGDR